MSGKQDAESLGVPTRRGQHRVEEVSCSERARLYVLTPPPQKKDDLLFLGEGITMSRAVVN